MYYNNETIVYFNGEWLKAKDVMVSPYIQVMHYGSGVFEGIRSYATPDGRFSARLNPTAHCLIEHTRCR